MNDPSSDELSLRYINVRGPDGKRLVGDVESTEIEEGSATEMECDRFRLRAEDRVYRIRRLRQLDRRPFMLEKASVPAALFPGQEDVGEPTHRVVCLARKYGILLHKAEERITIAPAPLGSPGK